jgi:hypothetical protein
MVDFMICHAAGFTWRTIASTPIPDPVFFETQRHDQCIAVK